jgi:tRNA U34 5-carboxymethylaminomethyl modifying GTPase MnmE/TrmE
MHEFYERSRPKWWQRIRMPAWKPLLAVGVVIVMAIAGYRMNSGSLVYEGFELHGGPVVIERVLETLGELGSRPALPGEFSFRAVRNGKMSVVEAQAVADLIAAKNPAANWAYP